MSFWLQNYHEFEYCADELYMNLNTPNSPSSQLKFVYRENTVAVFSYLAENAERHTRDWTPTTPQPRLHETRVICVWAIKSHLRLTTNHIVR